MEEIQFSIRMFALCHLEWFNSTNISLNKQTPKFKFMKDEIKIFNTFLKFKGSVHLKQNTDNEPRSCGVVGKEIINQKWVHCLRLS